VCPWAEEHTGGDTSGTRIGQYPDGALWFHCEHAHCAEREWEQIRERLEPGCYDGYDRSDSYDSSFKDLGDLPDAADFPLETLPGSFRDFVREASASIGCPPDLVGIAAIAAASAAIGDTRRIVIKRDWSESATVYGMAISPPGGKKSPAISAALKPARDRQMAHKLEYDRQMEEYEAVLKRLTKGDEKPPKPTLIRTYADDTTVERLADILNENKRGSCVEGVATGVNELGTLLAGELAIDIGTQEPSCSFDVGVSKRHGAHTHVIGDEGRAFGVDQPGTPTAVELATDVGTQESHFPLDLGAD
jgi:hypothetical protein